ERLIRAAAFGLRQQRRSAADKRQCRPQQSLVSSHVLPLENKLQTKLDLPRGGGRTDKSRVGRHRQPVTVKRSERLTAVGKVGMIQQVKDFRAKLNFQLFSK